MADAEVAHPDAPSPVVSIVSVVKATSLPLRNSFSDGPTASKSTVPEPLAAGVLARFVQTPLTLR